MWFFIGVIFLGFILSIALGAWKAVAVFLKFFGILALIAFCFFGGVKLRDARDARIAEEQAEAPAFWVARKAKWNRLKEEVQWIIDNPDKKGEPEYLKTLENIQYIPGAMVNIQECINNPGDAWCLRFQQTHDK